MLKGLKPKPTGATIPRLMGLDWRRLAAYFVAGLAIVALAVLVARAFPRQAKVTARSRPVSRKSVDKAVARVGPQRRPTLSERFAAQRCRYPPERLTFIALKAERRLEVWAPGADGQMRLVAEYPILAASGRAGPKLREGDRQVPEGVYRIVLLNPRSSYHLSMKLDYPNKFDRAMARREGRANLGGDIFIHGRNVSIGCLAMGDPAIEELFRLVKETGRERAQVIIAPADFRRRGASLAPPPGAPRWTAELYDRLRAELARYPR